jgi:Glucosyl transferase GtrII
MAEPGSAHTVQTDVLRDLRELCSGLYREYSGVFAGLLVLQLVTYTYCFTSLIFMNHTFPDAWVYPYPSAQTWAEGRWLADAIRLLQGGSGVQPFQMAMGVALHTINGILFARFVGLERRFEITLAAAFLCLYPAFLDYYSYPPQHITYALGDTFALLGILYCKHTHPSGTHAAISGALFVLALATYQPKIALIGLLCICYLVIRITEANDGRPLSWKETMLATGYVGCVLLVACLGYFLSTKLTITVGLDERRAYVNSPSEMVAAIRASFGQTLLYYTIGADYLPKPLRFLPSLGIALGCFAILHKAYRKSVGAAAVVVALLLLIPVVLQASYIINKNSWVHVGRIVSVNGYALLFFLSCGFQAQKTRRLTLGIVTACLYFFIVVGTQESNAAAFKTVYDINMINRIASRIETVVEDLYQGKYSLVVAGHYPEFARSRYVRMPNLRNEASIRGFTFEVYRQEQILNYFFGRDVLRKPTPAQMDKALVSVRGRRPWPAGESVYIVDGVIVVVLEKYRPDMPLTWTSGH